MKWPQIAPDFKPDGSLRDINVVATSLSDWQNVLDSVRGFEPSPTYSVNGVPTELPSRVEEAFKSRSVASPRLSLSLGTITLNCHFFQESDIEFDFDPAEVHGQDQLDALASFMRRLGKVTGKVVVLTPENAMEIPILRYSPDGDEVEWVPLQGSVTPQL
jgi:hypothetical protein